MKSNVYKINKGETDLTPLLAEAEKVAGYNELTQKDALYLRLLAEELVSMLPAIVEDYNGEFWIENDGNAYALCVKLLTSEMKISTRERLIEVSKTQKNAYAVGITGRIRQLLDYMAAESENPMISPAAKYGFATNVDFSLIWSMKQCRDSLQKEESEKEKWDELEKSILVKIADDVLVGVKGKNVDIVIKKTFADHL